MAAAAGSVIYVRANQAQVEYEHDANQHAQADSDGASIQTQNRCGLVAPLEHPACVDAERHAARERQERDLQAQLVTSAWTRAMGEAALIGMFVGIIGVGLIYTTFRETQRTATASDTAAETARDAHRSYVANERAVLRMGSAYLVEAQSVSGHKFRLRIQNSGRGNATIKKMCWSVEEGPIFPDNTRFEAFDSNLIAADDWGDVHFPADSFETFPVWLMGFLEYETLVDHTFRTHFCYELTHTPDDGHSPGRVDVDKAGCQNRPNDT